MPWMQRQSHLFDANTRLICRYHRLSTRFELIAEHVPSASGGLDSNLSDHNLVNLPMGVWSELILVNPYIIGRELFRSILRSGSIDYIFGHY
ncbi:hypothetical protein [Shewanella xiamenensis]|uniref:hypothetical protein n=1 Tax=Shewanella xiamenensis TaxID=332186 RepID=UPI002E7AC61E|nr:hypothetical protein [Shewanella xiamenensis]MEE1979408.1 hypothetical protein [Shewanella xiamenensis]